MYFESIQFVFRKNFHLLTCIILPNSRSASRCRALRFFRFGRIVCQSYVIRSRYSALHITNKHILLCIFIRLYYLLVPRIQSSPWKINMSIYIITVTPSSLWWCNFRMIRLSQHFNMSCDHIKVSSQNKQDQCSHFFHTHTIDTHIAQFTLDLLTIWCDLT